jgi:Flp pilus assembly protein TadG
VTVEAAIAIAAFVLVLAMTLSGISAMADQVRCVDAAREAARLTARGEPEQARTAAERIAPKNAEVRITMTDQHIEVHVNASPVGGLIPGVRLHAEAFAVREPDG